MRKLVVVVSLLAVAFAGVLVWAILTRNELIETRDMLSSTRDRLAVTTTELEETKDRLLDTTDELTSTMSELSDTKNELYSVRGELAVTESELSSTRSELSRTESELSNTTSELSTTQLQLTVAQETLGGLGITLSASKECYDVDLVDNPQATNPAWSELVEFLSQDRTETHRYIRNIYDCSQFSRDVHNNAEAAGIRAAEVHIDFSNQNEGHALNAFLTTDYGLVYVDCTGGPDAVARVEAGKVYRAIEVYRIIMANIRNNYWWDSLGEYYYIASSTGGEAATLSIRIFW